MHRKVAAALVAALALVAAGCGSSESLTRAQLVNRVEVACRQAQAQMDASTRARGGSQNDQQLRFVTALRDAQRTVLDKIDGLEPPDAAESDFDVFKQSVEDRLELIDRVASDGADDVASAIRSIQREAEGVGERAQQSARALGIDGCI